MWGYPQGQFFHAEINCVALHQERIDAWVERLAMDPPASRRLVRYVIARADCLHEATRWSVELPYILLPGSERPFEEGYVYPLPVRLPAVLCLAKLESLRSIPGREGAYSGMTVAWFQNEFAPPFDPEAMGKIENWDWDKLARDWEP